MTDTSNDFPHVQAAFINAICEEGSVAEACEWLQKVWNERCAIAAERDALRAEVERLRPLAERYVMHLETAFENSNDDGAIYHEWQDALAALKGTEV